VICCYHCAALSELQLKATKGTWQPYPADSFHQALYEYVRFVAGAGRRGVLSHVRSSPGRAPPSSATLPHVILGRWIEKVRNVVLGAISALILHALLSTLRWDRGSIAAAQLALGGDKKYIFAFWHRHLLGLPRLVKMTLAPDNRRVCVLISRHGDGRLIAHAVGWFKIESVAGSSSRGGRSGFLKMIERAKEGAHLAITPDGPRGPKGELKEGVISLALHTGLPVVSLAYAAEKYWQLRSWDGMRVPKPFSRAVVCMGEPVLVGVGEEEVARIKLKETLVDVTERADGFWVAS
jgi:lysophospholipid acyltransferase (LPLAT)-like uncharacterized protein